MRYFNLKIGFFEFDWGSIVWFWVILVYNLNVFLAQFGKKTHHIVDMITIETLQCDRLNGFTSLKK